MSRKTFVYLGSIGGSLIGSYLPTLWGAGFLSFSSVLFSAVGGIVGIIVVIKLTS